MQHAGCYTSVEHLRQPAATVTGHGNEIRLLTFGNPYDRFDDRAIGDTLSDLYAFLSEFPLSCRKVGLCLLCLLVKLTLIESRRGSFRSSHDSRRFDHS